MKWLGLGMLLALLLSGCSTPVWENVSDTAASDPVRKTGAYQIQLEIPEGVTMLDETESARCYSSVHGELEIETLTFLAYGLEHAVKQLSGFSAEDLTILKTSRFDLPEYQFAWVSQTEQGARLYRADLVMDGTSCYAVVCSSLEEAGDVAAFTARKVFSTFDLQASDRI